MKLATSYFYQIRNFKPFMIPFSTAVYDPVWFHDYKSPKYNFLDKNNVVNGLRIKQLRPNDTCSNLCKGIENCLSKDPLTCEFLSKYRIQIENVNIEEMMREIRIICNKVQSKLGFKEEPIAVFMFYEVPTKLCSERVIVHEVLNKRGLDVHELKYPIQDNY